MDDDVKLEEIGREYGAGRMLTGNEERRGNLATFVGTCSRLTSPFTCPIGVNQCVLQDACTCDCMSSTV
jgi:hypothetical protein